MKKISDTELEVMQAIWAYEPPVTREQINIVLEKSHPMAQTTLLTLLTRLEAKDFIQIQKQGRISVYTPLVSQKDYLARESKSLFDTLFHGNISAFASALCDSGISQEDLAELRELLDQDKL